MIRATNGALFSRRAAGVSKSVSPDGEGMPYLDEVRVYVCVGVIVGGQVLVHACVDGAASALMQTCTRLYMCMSVG
jgi:hypothetical protein